MYRGSVTLSLRSTKVAGSEIIFSASDFVLSRMVDGVRAGDHPNQFDSTELKGTHEISPRTVDHALSALLQYGLLVRGGPGRHSYSSGYRVAPLGFERIDLICVASEASELDEARELLRGAAPPVAVEAPRAAPSAGSGVRAIARPYIEPAMSFVTRQDRWVGQSAG